MISHHRVKPAPTDLEVKIGKPVTQHFQMRCFPDPHQHSHVRAYHVNSKPGLKSRGVPKSFKVTPKPAKYRKASPKVDPDLKLLNDLIADRKVGRPAMLYSARQEAHATRSWLEHKKHYGVDVERVKSKPIKIQQSLQFDYSFRKVQNRQASDYAFSREEFDRLKTQEQKSQHRSPGPPYEELRRLEREMELVMHEDSTKHSTNSLSILLQGLMRKGLQNGSIKSSTIVRLWVQAGNPAETAPIPYELIAQERARELNG